MSDMKYKMLFIGSLCCGIFLSAASSAPAASPAGNGFTVTGYLKGLKAPYVYLQWSVGDSVHKDSTAVKDGRFRFSGKVNEPVLAVFLTKTEYTRFFLENKAIQLHGSADSIDQVRITGSPTQRTYDSLQEFVKDLTVAMDNLYGQYSTASKNKDTAQTELVEGQIDSLERIKTKRVQAFIRVHPLSPVSLVELSGMFYSGDYDTLRGLYNGLDMSIQQTRLGVTLAKRLDILQRTALGQHAMDFTQSGMDSQAVQFSVYSKGKYVLLDFWASWCGPCRAENPNVLKAYNEFKDKNFVVLGVSLDDNGKRWKEAVAKDGMPWMQVSDLKGWKNEAAQQYGIQAIPANFLVDPNGVIIAKNLRGPALQKKLAEVVGEAAAGSGAASASGQSTASASAQSAASAEGQPSLEELRTAVETHPDSPAIHERYITAFLKSIPGASFSNIDSVLDLLKPQYDEWMKRFPKIAVVPFAIGHAFANAESPAAKPYLLKAVSLDPKMAEAWADLAVDAERWGDFDASDNYLKKAKEAEPANPDYAAHYAFAMERTDFAKYRELSLDVANRFTDSDRGAQMLYWLALRSSDEKEKETLYKLVKEKYPPAKFNWSASAMSNYFDLLLVRQPEQALALAKEMKPIANEDYEKKTWAQNSIMAEKVVEADQALNENRSTDAMAAMAAVHPGKYSDSREFIALLKAKVMDATGSTAAALDSLAVFYAKEPSDEVRSMMTKYAAKLGKNAAWVNDDVQHRRMADAQEAPAFDLYAYQTGQTVSLKDYRGKVVLLTFWFPGCGPCRGEFPHFQEVLNKFKGQDIAYVGINVFPGQDPYVLPFMRSSGYSFIPLRDRDGTIQKAYHVRGEPSNFLIDRDGRIIFSNFMIQNPKAQRMLEMMISSLLTQKS
jgi:peroxiredoxin